MIASFRRLSKSTAGTIVIASFFVLILIGFALQDVSGTLGSLQGSLGKDTLASAGGEQLSERELSSEMQRQLMQLRQQNPTADYSALKDEFDPLLESLIQQKALAAFADDQGIVVSKRLIDAEIARLPQAQGLDGRFSPEAYARFLASIRMNDADVRESIRRVITNRLMLAPASANPRVAVGIARPYAAMQLEVREADIGIVPFAPFLARAGNPTDPQLAAFYKSNQARYMVPEQRVLDIARIGSEAVANVAATDKEIADYYKANQATYGALAQRVISQVVLPSKQAADSLAAKLRSGTSFVDAAKPLGYAAADISVGPQTREEFAKLTSADVAKAVFAANVGDGAIVGPIRSDLGFHVVKIDKIQERPARSLESVRSEISEKVTADKRKNALADLIADIEDKIADGKNLTEALAGTGIDPVRTPPITAGGISRANPAYKLPAELSGVVRTGFDLDASDDPVVETLPSGNEYALVGVDQVIPAAPAPLAEIRSTVIADWKRKQAEDAARKIADAANARLAKGGSLEGALKAAGGGIALPPPQHGKLRRIELAQMGDQVRPALKLMFSLAEGRSRVIRSQENDGFVIVHVTKIVPGDATLQPGLVAQIQNEFRQPVSEEYGEQLARAVTQEVGVKRNDKAIADAKRRILGTGY